MFRRGEMESEANMLKVYKQINQGNGLEVRPKDQKNQEFQDNPKDLRNWSFCGEENLNN